MKITVAEGMHLFFIRKSNAIEINDKRYSLSLSARKKVEITMQEAQYSKTWVLTIVLASMGALMTNP